MKFKPVKLLAFQEVKIGDNKTGFFVKLKYDSKHIINEILVFEHGGQAYKLIGLYMGEGDSRYGKYINEALMSLHLSEEVQKDEFFKMAQIGDNFKSIIYTKDGKYPTESSDSLYLEVTHVDYSSIHKLRPLMKSLIKEVVGPFEERNLRSGYEAIEGGAHIVLCKAFINEDLDKTSIALLQGNETLDLSTLENKVNNMFITVNLGN